MTIAIQFRWVMVFPISILLLLTAGGGGCESLTTSSPPLLRFNTTKIARLQKRKPDAKVYVQGVVENQAPFVGAGAYQLEDNTGSVWVFTTQPLPELGRKMLIRGQVAYESIQLEGLPEEDLGDVYLKELERIEEPSPEKESNEDISQPSNQN